MIRKGIPHPKHRAKKQAQGLKKAEAYEVAENADPHYIPWNPEFGKLNG